MIYTYKLITEDKTGVTTSLVSIFSDLNINIEKLELSSEIVYIKFNVKSDLQHEQLNHALALNPYIRKRYIIDRLPSEKKYEEVLEMLGNLEHGILISDETYSIIAFNSFLERISGFSVGASLKDIFQTKHIFTLLQKKQSISNHEIVLKSGVRLHCSVQIYQSKLSSKIQYIWNFKTFETVQDQLSARSLHREMNHLDDIIYASSQMENLIVLAKSAAQTRSNILIRGESGTGKELFARGIHQEGKRSSSPFLAINCAAIPDNLLESELFGYEEGTFTGSKKHGKIGLFEQANGGTIFLDEIGDLSYHLQSKLLRLIETKSIRRLGSDKEIPLDIHVITATHQPLEERIEQKQFRLDLFYRLNVFSIHIPPLRLRKEDIPILTKHFFNRTKEQQKKYDLQFASDVIPYLLNHEWPGNIRELENVIERSVVLCTKPILSSADVLIHTPTTQKEKPQPLTLKPYTLLLEDYEARIFKKAKETGLSSRKLADILQLSHTTIANKLRKYTQKKT